MSFPQLEKTLISPTGTKMIEHFTFMTRKRIFLTENLNKPRTAKVGAISKAQSLKGGPFGLCETPAGCKKFEKKLKRGDPLGT